MRFRLTHNERMMLRRLYGNRWGVGWKVNHRRITSECSFCFERNSKWDWFELECTDIFQFCNGTCFRQWLSEQVEVGYSDEETMSEIRSEFLGSVSAKPEGTLDQFGTIGLRLHNTYSKYTGQNILSAGPLYEQ